MKPVTECSKGAPVNGLRQSRSQVAEHLPNDRCKTDAELPTVVATWPELPEAIKYVILAMVKAATGKVGWS
jgi:hypothetical protein